ncbi:MAG TPA: PaaI family thioesterase [Selenomonadales bacterium]|nr:PaaI family thioesterase [Selenomonadales bacterium]
MTSYDWLWQKMTRLLKDQNPFVGLLRMKLEALREGEAELSMPVIPEIHTNLFGAAHGGALASLADTVMGVACATKGSRVVTIDMNINYIQSAPAGEAVKACGRVIHHGKTTAVVEAEILDGDGQLLAKARGTFFVVGPLEQDDHGV